MKGVMFSEGSPTTQEDIDMNLPSPEEMDEMTLPQGHPDKEIADRVRNKILFTQDLASLNKVMEELITQFPAGSHMDRLINANYQAKKRALKLD